MRCESCGLVFVPERFFLTSDAEKEQYDFHENHPADLNYRAFLSRLFDPLIERVPPGACGLDFGSGPGPTLSVMLAESGRPTEVYDPFYAPNPYVWNQTYEFITTTEVLEHLHRPAEELKRLWSVLKPGGWMGIMTRRLPPLDQFANWHYKNDPTHVVFFASESFEFLASQWNAELQLIGGDVTLLRKP
ncbi:class I SAM-dependent methyltransferase [Rubinisphaera margarita]|uniref:class I SAM-dependent methyltransferase n=1 Tax=Rubinisphaera margarita TaxID=2909586 RepID=UPI001EE92470|nr:class I SAM-dependent methyltransferase [Rubinisphaera margarita]MCG6158182.1 class I SAM-dependent methyltransferase [Rubinisphaera margarita]